MLETLVQRYEDECREGRLPRDGWEKRNVSFALVIGKDGELIQVISIRQEVLRGKKTVLRPQELFVPIGETRTVGIMPFFLCDNASYFLGADTKGKPKRTADCFAAAVKLHENILADVSSETAEAVISFFRRWKSGEDAVRAHPVLASHADDILAGANLVFRYEGRYAHEDPEIRAAWERYRQKSDGDLELLWKAILQMFELDRSAARGNMATRELIVFRHESELGNAPAYQLFDRIRVNKKMSEVPARSYHDYDVHVDTENLPEGVTCIRMN